MQMQYDRVTCQDVKYFQIKWYRTSFGSLDAQKVCLVSVFVCLLVLWLKQSAAC